MVKLQEIRDLCDRYQTLVPSRKLVVDASNKDDVIVGINNNAGKQVALLTKYGLTGDTGVQMVQATQTLNGIYTLLNA